MLGVIVGRGGTGELGATLWDQTELSYYDDAMHGKWGMNYKCHARAVVFNEKHLLRLWDIAFIGYTGGMGVKMVKWTTDLSAYPPADPRGVAKMAKDLAELQAWQQAALALDEPVRPNIPDIFVISFDQDDKLDHDHPNPIKFSGGNDSDGTVAAVDPENL